uniref:Symplekin n=1 Tax=Lepeophtheirus salmonis TaxID=72036 RepID=A0A0K2TH07_LEPSM
MDSCSSSSSGVDAKLVDLLNEASIETNGNVKLEKLMSVQELLVRKEPNLLDNFLDEVMGFQNDRSQDIRRFVVGFIEEACKVDPELLPKVIKNVQILMMESGVAVQKRVIQAMTHLYKISLMWIARAKTVTEDMEAVWNEIIAIKTVILMLLDSDNDGIRTHTVKFMEMLVITQTHEEPESVIPSRGNDFNLDDVPLTLKIARPRKLEDEAREVLEKMINYHGSAHISSANLMTCMSGLSNIAKQRPTFLPKVITALEMLQANLPPTLAKSQVSSVRKHLKNQLLGLLKHPVAAEKHLTNITTLLTDLGASRDEVSRAMPKLEEMKRKAHKHKREQEALAKAKAHASMKEKKSLSEPSSKRSKLSEESIEVEDPDDDDDDDEDDDDEPDSSKDKGGNNKFISAVDITEKFILERLDPILATEIVLRSMARLPREIPPQFYNTYTPIASAGTEGQIKHVARLLATQFTAKNLGPGVEAEVVKNTKRRIESVIEEEYVSKISKPGKITTVIGGRETSVKPPSSKIGKTKVTLQPSGMSKKSSRTLKLYEITQPLKGRDKETMLISALVRMFKSERHAELGGAGRERIKIITTVVTHGSTDLKNILADYILQDFVVLSEIAFSWLYEEYCLFQGFNRSSSLLSRRIDNYNYVLCYLIKGIISNVPEGKEKKSLFRRIYLESPLISEEAITLLKQYVQLEDNALSGVELMKDLVMIRPTKQLNFLYSLLEFCSHDNPQVMNTATETVIQLHSKPDLAIIIEEYSVMYLQFLQESSPPSMIFSEERGRPIVQETWDEHLIKVCLHLYLSLLSISLQMFHHLATVYVETSGDVKRTILRVLDAPLQNVAMDSPELLELIDKCPQGSETLVTRIIHILTEKASPPPVLVDKVRNLYNSRVSDVRFLIPILNGLAKNEVIAALPKLIRLNQIVVKEVFSRLLSSNGPLSASDLLIALHTIDCDMKIVIKATALCFAEKSIYTQEVLVIVLQQLMELPTIPLLLMRTVIQSLTAYPKLIGFVMNILQRLIVKQVWRQKTLWDGFVKCCERTVPQSYTVLLQLPPTNLKDFFKNSPNMREPLLEHVQSFTESQRAHVSAAIMEVLYKEDLDSVIKVEASSENDSLLEPAPPGE